MNKYSRIASILTLLLILSGCHEATIERRMQHEIVYYPAKTSVETTEYHVSTHSAPNNPRTNVVVKHHGQHRPQFVTDEIEGHPKSVEIDHYTDDMRYRVNPNYPRRVIDKKRLHNLPGSYESQPH